MIHSLLRAPLRALLRAGAAAFGLLAFVAAAHALEPRLAPDPMYGLYADQRLSVPVGRARRIHLVCAGKGTPAVILSAGAGDWSQTWRSIQPELAARTRVCAWDRAGFGFSDPSPEPQDVIHTERDLEAALAAAKVRGPYILVGHGLGALESLIYADRRFRTVAGLVLEDPTVPGETALLAADHPRVLALTQALTAEETARLQRCMAAVATGTATPARDPSGCLEAPPGFAADARAAFARISARPGRFETEVSLWTNLETDTVLAQSSDRAYGGLPLIVLTAGAPQRIPEGAGVTRDMIAAYEAFTGKGWPEAHVHLAALSGRGEDRILKDAPHDLHDARPEAVRDAVLEVLAAARAAHRS